MKAASCASAHLLQGHEALHRLRALAGAHDEQARRQRIKRACVPNLCGNQAGSVPQQT